uniref:Hypothetical conserved protein n=1 Tax=uncultured prokaryote TaxID=198431 RepID=H5SCN0_9ZZZZ|nr:hypothetical conserved protein [uncultured prokaryote]
MRDVSLKELQDLLRQMPVMAEIHPLSLAFLPETTKIFEDVWQMVAELDMPRPQPKSPILALQIEPALQHRLPIVHCTHDPLTTELNQVLLKRYDFIKGHMLCQSQVADAILQHSDQDTVVLLLVDGLSYADVAHSPIMGQGYRLEPVLVDGVSNTEQGMKRIIGDPPLAQRLFDLGFRTCLGFTYWERAEEALTNCLFTGFGDRVWKVKSFDEVLAYLEGQELRHAFVQIVRMGLDAAAHRQRERPNLRAMVDDVLKDFERLAQLFKHKGVSASLHLVSDHGILWAHEHSLRPYEFSEADHPRYYEHARHGEHRLTVEFEGKAFALLEYPYLRRELRANEWGVHGGLSFEESVVPWLNVIVD